MHPNRIVRRTAIVAAIAASIIYLSYRIVFTLNLSGLYAAFASISLISAETYGCILMFLYFFQIWELREPKFRPPKPGQSVDVYIPTYNEPPELLRGTISAALAMRYPHETYVLDDGNRLEVAALSEELGAKYINRPTNLHAKAGNLNHAMEITTGDFVVIFDADHISRTDFIERLLGHFDDDRMGFVQTPHSFYNFDNFHGRLNYRRKTYWEEGELFYNVIQPGKNYWNAVSFCGSAAMFRRTALQDVGLVATETITEDMHTGLRLHARGWKSLFVNERLVTGQAATDVSTFNTQRLRWGEGNLGIFAYDNPLWMKGLTIPQRICYLGSMLSWTTGLQKLQLYIAPVLMLLTGIPPVAELSITLMTITLVYMLTIWTAVTLTSNGHGNLVGTELTHMASFWTQIRSTYRAVFKRRKTKFVVTSKSGRQTNSIRAFIAPQCLYIAASALAITWAFARYVLGLSNDLNGLLVGTGLILIQAAFAWQVIRRGLREKSLTGESWRHPCAMNVAYQYENLDGQTVHGSGVSCDINEQGIGFHAFEKIPDESLLTLRLTAGRICAAVDARICFSTKSLNTHSRRDGDANSWRYGAEFHAPNTASLAAIWKICSEYATARLYDKFENRKSKHVDASIERYLSKYVEHQRVNLPTKLCTENAGEIDTVTESLSRDSFVALLPREVPVDFVFDLELATPIGLAVGKASLRKATPVTLGCTPLTLAEFRFDKMLGESRSVLLSICGGSSEKNIGDVVSLTPPERKLPFFRPAMLVGALAVAAAVLAAGLMLGVNQDALLLSRLSEATSQPSTKAKKRLGALVARATKNPNCNEGHLLRLRNVVHKVGDHKALAKIDRALMRREPDSFSAKLYQAESYAASRQFEDAQKHFEYLLENTHQARDEEERGQLYVAAARNTANLGHKLRAIALFRQAPQTSIEPVHVRLELAGLLCSVGKTSEAVTEALHCNARTPNNQFKIASFLAADHQYSRSIDLCQTILDNGSLETDAKVHFEALSLLADCAQAMEDFDLACRSLKRLIPLSPASAQLRTRLALATLWNRDGVEARRLLEIQVRRNPDHRQLQVAFAQAMLLAGEPTRSQRSTLAKTVAHLKLESLDSGELESVAGALSRCGVIVTQFRVLGELLNRFPSSQEYRLQLIDALESTGQFELAKYHLDYLLKQSVEQADLEEARLGVFVSRNRQ